jgi:hypothetical protein
MTNEHPSHVLTNGTVSLICYCYWSRFMPSQSVALEEHHERCTWQARNIAAIEPDIILLPSGSEWLSGLVIGPPFVSRHQRLPRVSAVCLARVLAALVTAVVLALVYCVLTGLYCSFCQDSSVGEQPGLSLRIWPYLASSSPSPSRIIRRSIFLAG